MNAYEVTFRLLSTAMWSMIAVGSVAIVLELIAPGGPALPAIELVSR